MNQRSDDINSLFVQKTSASANYGWTTMIEDIRDIPEVIFFIRKFGERVDVEDYQVVLGGAVDLSPKRHLSGKVFLQLPPQHRGLQARLLFCA